MSSIDLVLMGVKNLWRRKLRTFLTVLGVIIGASSIIVMLSIGFGLNIFFENEIAKMGSLTTVNVYKSFGGGGMGMGMGMDSGSSQNVKDLNDNALEDFKNIPNVDAVSPILETYGTIISGRYIASSNIKGIDPAAMEAFDFKTSEGRVLHRGDKKTVVFGAGIAEQFHDPKARVWREINVDLMRDRMSITLDPNYGYSDMGMGIPGSEAPNYKEYKIDTAGILEEGDFNTMYSIYMPISEVEAMIKEKERAEDTGGQIRRQAKEYDTVDVKVNDPSNVPEVQETIKDMGFEAFSLNDQLDFIRSQTAVLQAVLGGIGAISLLVAAIGITNTMIMSIYERTKEIGIMKVIGASLKDIKRLFLFESALIGLLGGIFGVAFSYLLSFGINQFGAPFLEGMGATPGIKISFIPIWLVFASMAFSAAIGVIAGYFPARRAMNLSALDAIRSE